MLRVQQYTHTHIHTFHPFHTVPCYSQLIQRCYSCFLSMTTREGESGCSRPPSPLCQSSRPPSCCSVMRPTVLSTDYQALHRTHWAAPAAPVTPQPASLPVPPPLLFLGRGGGRLIITPRGAPRCHGCWPLSRSRAPRPVWVGLYLPGTVFSGRLDAARALSAVPPNERAPAVLAVAREASPWASGGHWPSAGGLGERTNCFSLRARVSAERKGSVWLRTARLTAGRPAAGSWY